MKLIILLVVCVLALGQSSGQGFKSDILAMQKSYAESGSMKIAMGVQVFEKSTASTPYYSLDVVIKKSNDQFHYMLGQNDMLMNDKYFIMVDRDAKEIIWSKRDVTAEQLMNTKMQFNLDSMLNTYDDAKDLGVVGNIRHYRVEPRCSDLKDVDFYIDLDSKFVKKLTYLYKGGQFVSIDFKAFEKDPSFASSEFDESQYIIVGDKGVLPAAKYKKFNLSTPVN